MYPLIKQLISNARKNNNFSHSLCNTEEKSTFGQLANHFKIFLQSPVKSEELAQAVDYILRTCSYQSFPKLCMGGNKNLDSLHNLQLQDLARIKQSFTREFEPLRLTRPLTAETYIDSWSKINVPANEPRVFFPILCLPIRGMYFEPLGKEVLFPPSTPEPEASPVEYLDVNTVEELETLMNEDPELQTNLDRNRRRKLSPLCNENLLISIQISKLAIYAEFLKQVSPEVVVSFLKNTTRGQHLMTTYSLLRDAEKALNEEKKLRQDNPQLAEKELGETTDIKIRLSPEMKALLSIFIIDVPEATTFSHSWTRT